MKATFDRLSNLSGSGHRSFPSLAGSYCVVSFAASQHGKRDCDIASVGAGLRRALIWILWTFPPG